MRPSDPVSGYATRCFADASFIRFGVSSNEDDAVTEMNIVGPDGNDFDGVCCEGRADEATADESCAVHCQELVCEAARNNHLDLALAMDDGLHICANADCGFNMNACLTGEWHQQTIQFIIQSSNYFLRAQCDNARTNEPFNDDGLFFWHQTPNVDHTDDPLGCKPAVSSEQDPDLVPASNLAVEDMGMTASVTWTIGSNTEVEVSQDAALSFNYDLHDCGILSRCLDLAALEVDIPPMNVQGIDIVNAHLSVYQVDSEPVVHHNGKFTYGPGTLHAVVSAVADDIPIVLSGSNSESAHGKLSPNAGTLTLSELTFDYCDSIITAELELDIVGTYVERGPTAAIVPVKSPLLCSKPVRFKATSSDPDGQPLTNFWLVPGLLVSTGPTVDVPLTFGNHMIGLISQDPDGHRDATALSFTRICL
jgi:hypothetical protein